MNSIIRLALWGLSIALTVKILGDLDFNKVVYNHSPGKCRYVEGIDTVGSEDLIMLSNGHALIASGVFVPQSSIKSRPGKLYLFDPTSDAAKAEPLVIKSNEKSDWKDDEFFPAGITVWEEKGETFVYAINTFTKNIDFFQLNINAKQLTHRKSIGNPLISNPNNLIAIAKDQFYVSNFVYYTNQIAQTFEFIQKLPFGTVWFHDGTKLIQVLDGLKGPNGIAVSKSKKILYLSTHFEEAVRVYRIESTPTANTNLTLINTVELFTGVDNLNVDIHGSVWIGAHPIAYKTAMHMLDYQKNSAPSQVLKVTFNEDHSKWHVREIYADDGEQLQGSTVAALTNDGRKLLIGTLFHKTLICQLVR